MMKIPIKRIVLYSLLVVLLGAAPLMGKTVLIGCDLSGACFRYMALTEANLSFAVFRGTDFQQADLNRSNFHSAILTRSNFKQANLREAMLTFTDLSDCDLSGADLRGADLTGAWLQGADLTGALMDGAEAQGLVMKDVTCPDGTMSNDHQFSCDGHFHRNE